MNCKTRSEIRGGPRCDRQSSHKTNAQGTAPSVVPESHDSGGQLHDQARALRYLLAEPKKSENRDRDYPAGDAEEAAHITEAEAEQKIERYCSAHLARFSSSVTSKDTAVDFRADMVVYYNS